MDKNIQPQDVFFALDIGTRSVIGVIGIIDENEDLIKVLDIEAIEHPKRAMIDGQIEDIAQVSRIAKLVKSRLEERLGYTLTRVNVAAAGRALKTHKSVGDLQLNRDTVIDAATVRSLETIAITKANDDIIAEQQTVTQFFCVGYSVMKYYLDDYQISTLIGHKGDQCKVEMIVTFLPNEVVESLYSAMNGIELQVESLTLEPIAAMNAVIPQELRGLNLALVDIGAGTSDIAISNDGSVVAYAMATVAGDEITEMLTKKYIVDFETAEEMKQSLSLNTADVTFTDILGGEYTIPANEVFQTIKPALEHLCNVICDKILEVNEHSPSAVFLVGGASKIPYICGLVAERLNLDPKRVAVGGSKPLKKTVTSELDIFSPEFVTPIGIVVTAAKSVSIDDLVVTVNNEKVTLFHRSGVTVMDLLLSCGYRYSQMLGTSGKSLIYTLNGEKHIVRGSYPTPATITVNGKPTSLFMPVNGSDIIEIAPAVSGIDAETTVKNIVSGSFDIDIRLNEKPYTVGTRIMRGELPLNPSDIIFHNDNISTVEIRNIFDLCDYLKLNIDDYGFIANDEYTNGGYTFKQGDAISFTKLDQSAEPVESTPAPIEEQPVEPIELIPAPIEEPPVEPVESILALAEEQPVEPVESVPAPIEEQPVEPVESIPAPIEEQLVEPVESVPDLAEEQPIESVESIPAPVEERPVEPIEPIPAPTVEIAPAPTKSLDEINNLLMKQHNPKTEIMGEATIEINITLNGRPTSLVPKVDGTPYLFFDMLNLVNIDPSKPQGNIILNHNGEDASFMTPVKNGDVIDIHWEDQAL